MRPLRILHVTPYSAGAWAYGGIPRLTDTLTRELARRGHQVTICATDACDATARLTAPAGHRARLAPWPPIRVADGVELRVFPNLSNGAAYHWQAFAPLGLSGYLKHHAADFDVAHLHACRNLPGVIAARHLSRAGVPYVLAPNGTAPRLERRVIAKGVFDAMWGHRVLHGAARVLAVSDAERRQLASLDVADERIALVPNPIDTAEFDGGLVRGRFRRRFNLGDAPVVLFLGKLTPRKRLDVLVNAFARLGAREAQLVIAGNDMGSGHTIRTLVATMGLAARTTFTGLLRGTERLEALADADVVVYPSEDEIFGLVPLEALLAGSPVVVADDSGCGEVIRSVGGGEVVRTGDVAALAAAMDGVLASPDSARARAALGAQRVRERFAAPVVAEAAGQMYTRVVEGRQEPATHRAGRPSPGTARPGVSFVVPVRNGAPWIRRVVQSIRAQKTDRPTEILVVEDGSTDDSQAILRGLAESAPLEVIDGPQRGAAAALNAGIRAARYPLIAQVDQDVVLHPAWLSRLAGELDDPSIAAAQGQFVSERSATVTERVTGLDLQDRYSALEGRLVDHVCTGNSVYRAQALVEVGLFDENLGYAYDNDMSYRLRDAGHRLVFRRDATSTHHWRQGLADYGRQQYGLGYGRLDLVARYPGRASGDDVSPALMMAHPALMSIALASAVGAGGVAAAGGDPGPLASVAATIIAGLAVERLVAGVRTWFRLGDPAALLFPAYHLYRDGVWVAAASRWALRRGLGGGSKPSDSMRPRSARRRAGRPVRTRPSLGDAPRVIALIPAHNEAATLPVVINSVREHCPGIDVLVVDDGSRDGTQEVLDELGVSWLAFPNRLGIGSAMRAGLRYARRLGYDAAVRLDGDGQHEAASIASVLAPILSGDADVVLGSRFATDSRRGGLVGTVQRVLARCLSRLTATPVTDPTSGFCALGPLALRILADHHPTGYPEPELRLFLTRNGLEAVEVPVLSRPRLGGRSSLTPGRLALAGARVLLALIVVPRQSTIAGADHD